MRKMVTKQLKIAGVLGLLLALNGCGGGGGSGGGSGAPAPPQVVLNWTAPAAITYGTPLNATQLDATSSTQGTFSYSPGSGTVLSAGTHTLTATFTPASGGSASPTTVTTTITVNKATPTITWATPAAVPEGTSLSSAQLDASASVAGTFTYSPPAGTTLSTAGNQTLSVAFTPSDSADYVSAQDTVTLVVNAPAAGTATQPEGVAVVGGQLVVAGTSTPFIPRGFTTDGVIYPTQYASTLCGQPDIAPGSQAAQYLEEAQAALTAAPLPGLAYNASFQAMVQDWRLNSVRMQVSQGALQYEAENGLSAYTDMVRSIVAQARAAGLIVILSMQAERYSCAPYQNGNLQRLPDVNTEQAWAQLLSPTLTNDKGVILEIFNEPDPTVNCNAGTYQQPDWTTWATGCGSEPDQGMLTVGQYVRSLAPNNVLLFDGTGIDFAFVGFTPPSGMPSNSAYTFHPYDYVVNSTLADSSAAWDTRFGNFATSGHAVFVTEWDEAYSCPSDPSQTITNYFIQTYLPSHSIGMMGYAWDAPVSSSGYMVNSYDYPGDTANYQLVDPNTSGCAEDGGAVLQKQFQAEAASN